MVDTSILYISLILALLLLVMLSDWLKVTYPVILVLGGLALSFLPGLPEMKVNPELMFIIFLPPLLYDAAWYASWKNLWRWRRVISGFAFPIVLITSFVIALVSSTLIPGFTLALGFLLGGIISPPDAVSATSILKHVKVPRRISVVLEGESLLNDASSLIVYRFALVAVSSGTFIYYEAALSFVWVIVMGVLIGVAVGMLYFAAHRWLPTDSNIDIVLTLTTPYVMYLVAENFHVSGVIAVVSGALFLSERSHNFLSHSSRTRATNVWAAFGFLLNGVVFLLIGLELPVIVSQLGSVSLGQAIYYGCLITAVLIVTRIICSLGVSAFTMFISRFIKTEDNRPGWKGPIIIGWAGMRGVVSLAAALSIPLMLSNGTTFPQRNLILFITFTVILLTLVLHGLTLPLVIKWVNMDDPDHYMPPEEQELMIRKKLAEVSLKYLQDEHAGIMSSNTHLQQLKERLESDMLLVEFDGTAEQKEYRKIYLYILKKQRATLLELNKSLETDEEMVKKYQGLLDLEEEKIKTIFH
ncbi:Na+/H+ antiporter [Arcticibacter eurypsychrophilus]|uniref:Na+/H+ antiporter n=1 Tax=Arcticibacter eurypsychrophilus TaxID=1434752 RepID=UPI00084D7A4F|nr:Na+/H+ antiporter [Arcticibacter eurypsychrophilus]